MANIHSLSSILSWCRALKTNDSWDPNVVHNKMPLKSISSTTLVTVSDETGPKLNSPVPEQKRDMVGLYHLITSHHWWSFIRIQKHAHFLNLS